MIEASKFQQLLIKFRNLSEKLMRIKFYKYGLWVLTGFLALLLGVLLGTLSDIENQEDKYPDLKYSGMEDINVEHHVQTQLAKIEIVDIYVKDGVTYYEIMIPVIGNTVYTYSEQEYDDTFGLENTAFDCKIYSLCMKSDVIGREYSSFFSYFFNVGYIAVLKNIFESLPESNTMLLSDISFTTTGDDKKYICDSLSNDGITFATFCQNELAGSKIYSSVSATRYSFLNETDFTTEEIQKYKQELDMMNNHIAQLYYQKMTDFNLAP